MRLIVVCMLCSCLLGCNPAPSPNSTLQQQLDSARAEMAKSEAIVKDLRTRMEMAEQQRNEAIMAKEEAMAEQMVAKEARHEALKAKTIAEQLAQELAEVKEQLQAANATIAELRKK